MASQFWKLCILLVAGIALVFSISARTLKIKSSEQFRIVHVKEAKGSNETQSTVAKEAHQHQQHYPSIAWIMSFGGSGTSYTIMNVETATKTTTATNYVEYSGPCVGISPKEPLGPCLHRSQHPIPRRYILTKTHCAAYCMDCPPKMYRIPDAPTFEESCRSGTMRNNNKRNQEESAVSRVEYPRERVPKAIHLIRDPFDNLIGRLHLSAKRKRRQGKTDEELYENLTDWCEYLDAKALKEETSSTPGSQLFPTGYIDQFQQVPCHVEWFRYIQWHNLAFQSTRIMKEPMDVHYLYYDDYATNYNATVTQVLDFLELQEYNTGKVKHFVPGKSYRHMFSEEHQILAKAMIKALARPLVWDLIRHYFDGIPDYVDGAGRHHDNQHATTTNNNKSSWDLNKDGRPWHEVLWGSDGDMDE